MSALYVQTNNNNKKKTIYYTNQPIEYSTKKNKDV